MGERETPGPDLRDLLAAVGQLLLAWGWLEEAIRMRLTEIEPSITKPKDPILRRWFGKEDHTPEFLALYNEIVHLSETRNTIAHGLASARGNPWEYREPAVVCRTQSGEVTITLSELRLVGDSLGRASHRVRKLRYANLGR